VLCREWQGRGTMLQVLCLKIWLLLLDLAQLLLQCIKLRSENQEGLHVSIPERMVSCRLLLVHVRKRLVCHQPILMQRLLHCCMGRSVVGRRLRRWAVLVTNVNWLCVVVPGSRACPDAVLLVTVCLPAARNLELCRNLCPWRFL